MSYNIPIIGQKEEEAAILARCHDSIEHHLRVFHPEHFDRRFTERHRQLFSILDNPERPQKILVIAHRGFGKTTIFNFGIPSQSIVFAKDKFIIPLSASATHCIQQSENLKRELQSEAAIKKVIGDVKTDTFSKECWVTGNGTMIMPRGSGQQVRGQKFGKTRPSLLICDDMETTEMVMNEERRAMFKMWFFSDLLNSIDRAKKNWRIIVVGTILHQDALLQHLREDPTWTTVEFPLCDENLNSYWPDFMTTEEVKSLRDEYDAQGQLEVFYREYMNVANPPIDAVFQEEYFQRYSEGDGGFERLNETAENVVIVDPAKTAKTHNDYTAIVGVAWQPDKKRIILRDVINEHLRPEAIYDKAFEMCKRINARVIGVEVTGLNEFVTQPFKNEMFRRGLGLEFVELKARSGTGEFTGREGGKRGRIAALAPYYRMGQVWHNRACCTGIESQLLAFPKARHDDISDAFAYIIELLHIGDRYFDTIDIDSAMYDLTASDSEQWKQLAMQDLPPLEDTGFYYG